MNPFRLHPYRSETLQTTLVCVPLPFPVRHRTGIPESLLLAVSAACQTSLVECRNPLRQASLQDRTSDLLRDLDSPIAYGTPFPSALPVAAEVCQGRHCARP